MSVFFKVIFFLFLDISNFSFYSIIFFCIKPYYKKNIISILEIFIFLFIVISFSTINEKAIKEKYNEINYSKDNKISYYINICCLILKILFHKIANVSNFFLDDKWNTDSTTDDDFYVLYVYIELIIKYCILVSFTYKVEINNIKIGGELMQMFYFLIFLLTFYIRIEKQCCEYLIKYVVNLYNYFLK
jgi:hypothetical protein